MTTHGCCLGCGKENARHVCTGCHVARYCDRDCQLSGWLASHEVACGHFRALFGVKGFRLDSDREKAGFNAFAAALVKLGFVRRGELFTATSPLCDYIIQIVHACFPDVDLDAIDTLEWHAGVMQDIKDHAKDDMRQILNAEWKQLWRNLPRSIADLFITKQFTVLEGLKEGAAKHTSLRSVVELDRSRLSLLPPDVQLMLLEGLPAYSIFAVIDTLAEETRKAALILLMDRDIFHPIARSGLVPSRYLTEAVANRKEYERMTFPQLRQAYDSVTNSAADALVANATEGLDLKTVTRMHLEGQHFGLEFSQAWRDGRGAEWTVHPIAAKRFFRILPNELDRAIRNFSSLPSSVLSASFADGSFFADLVKLVVQKIDPSVAWRVKLSPHYVQPVFTWPSPTGPYKAPMDTIVSGPETAYHLVAEHHGPNESKSRLPAGTPVSSLKERLVED